jgi:tRNA(adenine34) deaminase
MQQIGYFCPMFDDAYYMREALRQAQLAAQEDEVPIGCVIVWKDRIIARAYNRTEQLKDFTAHAEMQAFTSASEFLNNKYLNECTLYVTLEPCAMCSGAAFWTQLGSIVFGATDRKRGISQISAQLLHPSTLVKSGVLEEECAALLSDFFKRKRKEN